jgi:hypothetical protein
LLGNLYGLLLQLGRPQEAETVADNIHKLQAIKAAAILYRIGNAIEAKDNEIARLFYSRGSAIGTIASGNKYVQLCVSKRDQLSKNASQQKSQIRED